MAELGSWLQRLAEGTGEVDDATRIDLLAAMERVKSGLSAAQARVSMDFKASQIAKATAAGVRRDDRAKGIAAQIGLARRESPRRAASLVGLAQVLTEEMPNTMAALTAGEISEWRATLMARETACLSAEHRREVDAVMAKDLGGMSDRRLIAEAQRVAYRLDPHSFLKRSSRAAEDRRVTLRPAPDVMTRLCALLPTVQGVAVFAALCREADRRKAEGDQRSRGQLLADILVERATGQSRADQTPVEVGLLMTAESLVDGGMAPACISGYGPIPAASARQLLQSLHEETRTWVRRLLTDPVTGRLIGYDTKRRLLTGVRRDAIVWRDQWCRTPWCGAPIRHIDHPVPASDGGETSEANSQGLCEACNYLKDAAGWSSRPDPQGGAGEAVTITTPTGHTYESRPPPLPGAA